MDKFEKIENLDSLKLNLDFNPKIIMEQNFKRLAMQLEKYLMESENLQNESLKFLLAEDYKFSRKNSFFLQTAAQTLSTLDDKTVQEELIKNLSAEEHHADIYKAGLAELGVNIESYKSYAPTVTLFESITTLLKQSPSSALGTIYALESCALYGLETFKEISKRLAIQLGMDFELTKVKHFYWFHLNGVEQSHKDSLLTFFNSSHSRDDEPNVLNIRIACKKALETTKYISTWSEQLMNTCRSLAKI